MKNKNQKIKLLRILEILRQDTDAKHPMSTTRLIERLAEEGIASERKSIYDDIRTLAELDYPVVCVRHKVNEYYLEDRSFSMAELRLLIDSVQAANFLSAKKAKELAYKLSALANGPRGEKLTNITTFKRAGRRSDDATTANIETLQQALERKLRIRFRYFNLDLDKQRTFRRNKSGSEWYEASPRGLVCSEGNYYLVCTMPERDHYFTYRVDRMSEIGLLSDKVTSEPWIERQSWTEFLKGNFGMYAGEKTHVSLLCKNEGNNINLVVDEFGYDLKLIDRKDGYFSFGADVQISPVFYGWLVTMMGKVWLCSPADKVAEYHRWLAAAAADPRTDGDK